MTPEPAESLLPSPQAMQIVRRLADSGGTMRLKPLLRSLDMDARAFIDAANDLKARYWISFVWRTPSPPGDEDAESRPHTDIDRLVVTRFGRRKWKRVWWMV